MFKPIPAVCLAIAMTPIHFAVAHNHTAQDDHALVQDVYKPGTDIEFDEDQDEVFAALQRGYVRPFSEMYAAVERDLHGRIIEVELEQDDGIWVYELKLNHNNNIIEVEYNAQTFEMLKVKGRDVANTLKRLED